MYEKLLDVIHDNYLVQVQHKFTRITSVLDFLFTNKPGLIKDINTIPGISDHDTVAIDTALKLNVNRKLPRNIKQWTKADWGSMKKEALDYQAKYFNKPDDRSVKARYKDFQDLVTHLIDKFVPSKMSLTRRNLPWCTPSIRRMTRKKKKLHTKWKKSHSQRDWEAYKSYQKATIKALKEARWTYIEGMLIWGLEEGNNRSFWKYVKSQREDGCGVAPLKEEGQLYADSPTKARILNNQFCSLFTQDNDDPSADTVLEGPSYPPLERLEISVAGVAKLLGDLNPSKAGGPDEVPCRLLKELGEELAPILADIFRHSLATGHLPQAWKSVYVSPIFKKGAVSAPENYRPVSLTCVPCKFCKHIICSHIRGHLDKFGALVPNNHGFRKSLSCDTQLALTLQDLFTRRDPRR